MDTINEGVYDQNKESMGSENALRDFEVNVKKISTSGDNCIDSIRSLIAFSSNKAVMMLDNPSQTDNALDRKLLRCGKTSHLIL